MLARFLAQQSHLPAFISIDNAKMRVGLIARQGRQLAVLAMKGQQRLKVNIANTVTISHPHGLRVGILKAFTHPRALFGVQATVE